MISMNFLINNFDIEIFKPQNRHYFFKKFVENRKISNFYIVPTTHIFIFSKKKKTISNTCELLVVFPQKKHT